MGDYHATSDPENVKGQIWCAFGRGVGEMKISAEAAAKLLELWQPSLEALVEVWSVEGPHILARTTNEVAGQAAARASEAGRNTILGEDISWMPCGCIPEAS